MWFLLSGNLLKWRLCHAEKIFHPLGGVTDVHKPPQVKRHELCHILFSSVTCMWNATKCCSPYCFALEANLLVTINMTWQTEGQEWSYMHFDLCPMWNIFFKNIIWQSTVKQSFKLTVMTLVFQHKQMLVLLRIWMLFFCVLSPEERT